MGSLGATVAILTFNGEEFLDEVLRACLAQDAPFNFEILVIDSGSSDGTLGIVARYPEVRVHRIPNSEFGHGRTRNLAVTLARGEIVVFLTQDATPVGPTWLAELVAPFDSDHLLAGVFARQIPRPGCNPTVSRDVVDVFRHPPAGFFSNVCSAVRREVFDVVPFRDVDYAEDQAFATDVVAHGLRVAYVPSAAVHHSHDLGLRAYFRRMYDEAAGLARVGRTPRSGLGWLAAAAVRGVVKDWVYLATEADCPAASRVVWAVKVPAFNMARRAAIWLAARPLTARMTQVLSLDGQRRRVATVS